MKLVKGFLLLIQFLTRLPVPVKLRFDSSQLAASFPLSPLVGLLCGVVLGGASLLLRYTGAPFVNAAVLVFLGVLLSGGLHLDGFADTCDGLYSYRGREETLAIMKDSRVGVFGVVGLILLILLKTLLLTRLPAGEGFYLLLFMPAFGRLNSVWSAGVSSYAGKPGSVAAGFVSGCGVSQVLIATLLTVLPALWLLGPVMTLLMLCVTLGPTLYFTRTLKKRLGGVTGDTLGYTIETGEVLFLAGNVLMHAIRTILAGGVC